MIGLMPEWLNPDKAVNPEHLIGRQQAGHEFTTALLRFLPEQSVGLFVPEPLIGAFQRDLRRFADNSLGHYRSASVLGIKQLPHQLRQQTISVLHNSTSPHLHTLAYLRAQFSGRTLPITSLIHGISHPFNRWDIFARLLNTSLLPCDSVICTSSAARVAFEKTINDVGEALRQTGTLRQDLNMRLDVIPLGVNTEQFTPRDRAAARCILGLPQQKTMILYFGRIDAASKADINPLLIACKELKATYKNDVILVFAGGIHKQTYDLLLKSTTTLGIAEQVIVRVQPSLTEAPLYYNSADIFVSPSDTLQESFGITPLEAMASGVPVVTSDWSGYRDTVVHGETGFRIPSYWTDCNNEADLFAPLYTWEQHHLKIAQSIAVDLPDMIRYLDLLVSKPELRISMGTNARQHVVTHYDWRVIVERVWNLWVELEEIARQLRVDFRSQHHLEKPNSFLDYGHFASRPLDGSETLGLTTSGYEVIRTKQFVLMHPEMQWNLRIDTLLTILNYMQTMNTLKQKVIFQNVCNKLGGQPGSRTSDVAAHLMWLIKYGMITLTEKQ